MFDTLLAARKNVSTSGNIPYPTASASGTTNKLTELGNTSLLGNSEGNKLNLNNHLTGCICEGCRSTYVNLYPQVPPPVAGATLPLASLPLLSSNPSATSKVFLDFNGHTTSGTLWNSNFNGGANIVTPAYSIDADTTTFSTTEAATIEEIWRRVAEDYAPFNVDVTTIDPGNLNAANNIRVVIGGAWDQWFEESGGAGGVAYLTSWRWNDDTPVFVFEENLGNGAAKFTAEAISHEAGHSLGLQHQSTYNNSGNKIDEYNPGSGSGATGWAPIMGVSYYQNLTTWHNGTSSLGSTSYQDDMNVISAANNGFGGYRTDDHGNTISSATALSGTTTLTGSGIISQTSDIDVFSFAAGAGLVNFTINPAQDGPNLDIVAELINSSGNILASSNLSSNLFANLNTSVTPGTYFLSIKSNGQYGRVGQYTINGTVAPADTTPPTASSFSPADNATGVAISANLVVNFNEVIQKGTGPIVIKKVSDNSVVETIAVTALNVTVSGSQLTIDPTANLGQGTDYYVEIANGAIKDTAGNNYAGITGNSTWNFTTTGQSVANDNFGNRIFLGGLPVSTTGSNIGTTGEVGEPIQSGVTNSAWWSWTAPSTGTVTFDTIGSNFDTWLSAYTGSPVNNLSLIGFDDDGGGVNNTSKLTRNVTAGTTYQIAVDGWQSNTGQINLNITAPPPANDNFVNAIALTGATVNSTGSNHGATGQVGEPAQSGQINSAWWSWTAPSSGFFQVDTAGSNFDSYLSVLTGPTVNNLSLIGADDDLGPGVTSLYNLNATAGTTYRIAVDGFSNYSLGSINLNIAPTAPPNDNFANRIALTGSTANATGSNIRATGEANEPAQSWTTESVWWTWTAPATGNYTFDTIGSNFDTWLSVYTGSAVNNLTRTGFDDDGGVVNNTSKLTQSVTAGTTYQIAVDGWSSNTGQIQLHIAPTPGPAPVANLTETANADTINGLPDSSAGNAAKNTLKEKTGEDPLTGGPAAGSLILPFAEPSVSASPGTDFAIGEEKDLLTEGGSTVNAPSLFSPVANSVVPTLEKPLSPVFTDANGALPGNQALGFNSDPFRVAADPYQVGVYEAKPFGI